MENDNTLITGISSEMPYPEAVERLELFYRNYLNTPMAICYTDPHGNIVDANNAFLDLYGYGLEEVRGKNPNILKSGRQSPSVYKTLWESISNREIGSWTGELINRRKNGEEVYVLLTISSVFRPDGSLIGYIASTMDITKRKDMELELQRRNEELERMNRFKSEMMAITSHDLKSPLNAMISYADLIRESLDSMPGIKTTEYLTKISEYGKQLTQFIGELLDLTKIESGKFQLVTTRARLDSVLQGCIDINQAHSMSKGIRINFSRVGRNSTAVVDVLRMSQVFNNTLSNAVKFSPRESVITVTYTDEGSGTVKITIDDQGPGIPEEDLAQIFDQYYQVMKEGHAAARAFGAGIGLSVVKTIVNLHHGTVSAENLADGGCRFTLEMPIKTFTSVRGLAVLIYDPQTSIFSYVDKPARANGVDCFTAVNIREALRIIDLENPDIVFVSGSVVSGDTMAFLKTLTGTNKTIYVIRIAEEEAPEDGMFYRTLITPVIDLEINDILKEIFMKKQMALIT